MISPSRPTRPKQCPPLHALRIGDRGYALDPTGLTLYEVDEAAVDVLQLKESEPTGGELPEWITKKHSPELLAAVRAELDEVERADAPAIDLLPETTALPLRLRRLSLLVDRTRGGRQGTMTPEVALGGCRILVDHRDPNAPELAVHLAGASRTIEALPLQDVVKSLQGSAEAAEVGLRLVWDVPDPAELTRHQVARLAEHSLVPVLDLTALVDAGPLPEVAPEGIAEVLGRFGPRPHPRVRLSAPRALEIAGRLRAWGFGGMHVAPQYDGKLSLALEEGAVAGLAQELRLLAQSYLEDVVADRPSFALDNLWDTLRQLRRSEPRSIGDSAGLASLALTADGALLPGLEFAGNDWVGLGTVAEGVRDDARRAFRTSVDERVRKCAGCWCVPFCAGGPAWELFGPAGERDERHCTLIRETAEVALMVQTGIAAQRPDLLPVPEAALDRRIEVGPYLAIAVNL